METTRGFVLDGYGTRKSFTYPIQCSPPKRVNVHARPASNRFSSAQPQSVEGRRDDRYEKEGKKRNRICTLLTCKDSHAHDVT